MIYAFCCPDWSIDAIPPGPVSGVVSTRKHKASTVPEDVFERKRQMETIHVTLCVFLELESTGKRILMTLSRTDPPHPRRREVGCTCSFLRGKMIELVVRGSTEPRPLTLG